MDVWIWKNRRRLELRQGEKILLSCPVALGRSPEGPKEREGDGRTPEGVYFICLCKEQGKYGKSLGLSYPSPADAARGLARGQIGPSAYEAVLQAHRQHVRPPWGTALGGEIYLHEGGTASDWTQGCVALESGDMAALFDLREQIAVVHILP